MKKIDVLKWILRLHALFLIAAIVPIFFPYSVMNWIHEKLGMGILPEAPITDYLTRSLSLVYALHGGICLILTFEMRKYLPLIRAISVFHLIFGITITGIDISSGMPILWTIGEGPMIVIFAIVIFVFCGFCAREPEQ